MRQLGFLMTAALLAASLSTSASIAQEAQQPAAAPPAEPSGRPASIKFADVVALDQLLVYNRFGSFNPYGMIYALRRDVSAIGSGPKTTPDCSDTSAVNAGEGELLAGKVALKPCKRPRPLVLRANVGDILEVRFTNLLRQHQPDVSKTFCAIETGSGAQEPERAEEEDAFAGLPQESRPVCVKPGGHDRATDDARTMRTAAALECATGLEGDGWRREATDFAGAQAEGLRERDVELCSHGGADWPATRLANLVIPGLVPLPTGDADHDGKCAGLIGVAPDQSVTCRWLVEKVGTHLFSSFAAIAGGEGDGGSLTHGLFGAFIAEPEASTYYRSQFAAADFERIWPSSGAQDAPRHARSGAIDYELEIAGGLDARASGTAGIPCEGADAMPVARMTRACGTGQATVGDETFDSVPVMEIVHGDLNAVIRPGMPVAPAPGDAYGADLGPFREFTVIFHDELKTYYTDQYREVGRFGQLAGVGDGFAINYGAAGLGTMLVANRKGIGPAANCVECLYEEFFLGSWANGDPALLEQFDSDPSNVHHSYLNDRIVFRNFHAGPKETHVFHLHAHQWWAGNDSDRGAYLDSQTIGPQQGFSYEIYRGGMSRWLGQTDGASGFWEALGSGNRNRTPGDAIFHCHLYPHFAQGMWSLWRIHDVLEDGTRLLPDGQGTPGLSLAPDTAGEGARRGSVTRDGAWDGEQRGTPIPAVLPLMGQPAPLLPTYGEDGMPGYPFYIPGEPGHRPPQAPLDIARAEAADDNGGRDYLDGGLPRHVVLGGERTDAGATVAEALAAGDMTAELETIELAVLPFEGTPLEKRAMAFHHDGRLLEDENRAIAVLKPDGSAAGLPARRGTTGKPGYGTLMIGDDGALAGDAFFNVNGAPPKPGAPFADPCGVAEGMRGFSRFGWPDAGGSMLPGAPLEPIADQFYEGEAAARFVPDPALGGFRRFDVSALQLQLVVNRAGWHDPQARIAALSSAVKGEETAPGAGAIVKAAPTATAEPFFFRAFSGDCIELRHTNETPKDLALDDFQMKVPTDTIGQHIHLVKFDVTSSDGSANGFNYEDGTFAPGEIQKRLCVARTVTHPFGNEEIALREVDPAECGKVFIEEVWKKDRQSHRQYFQTTVQRWFADPMLSRYGTAGRYGDRTMRTVFSHDHFAASNIQQHGYYTALLIEPRNAEVTVARRDEAKGNVFSFTLPGTSPIEASSPDKVVLAGPDHVGTRATVRTSGSDGADEAGATLHPNAREFALAVADFALLYDGKPASTAQAPGPSARGIDRLVADARRGGLGEEEEEGQFSPADWRRAELGLPDSAPLTGPLFAALEQRRAEVRRAWGKPVAPPLRPEAISTSHHDPYMVNYRTEPIPLRVGALRFGGDPLLARSTNGCNDATGRRFDHTDIKFQASGEGGDMASVFRSDTHGDPCTPVLEAYHGERVLLRMIQGAQEVQHMFTIEGRAIKRNIDQKFPMGYRLGGDVSAPTVWGRCMLDPLASDAGGNGKFGYPEFYDAWLSRRLDEATEAAPDRDLIRAAFAALERRIAECDNAEGYVAAQEIGISEHFEIEGVFSSERGVFRSLAAGVESADVRPADSLFHMGTIDALWNGAWGLIRIFRDERALDYTACLAAGGARPQDCAGGGRIGERLGGQMLPDDIDPSRKNVAGESVEPAASSCPVSAPVRQVAVVAAEARHVLPDAETRYSSDGRLYDKDGLKLVALDPAAAGPAVAGLFELAGDVDRFAAAALGLDAVAIRTAARDALAARGPGPHPFVMRARAGECLRLVVINTLEPDGRNPPGIEDDAGDAPMPPIVSLNVRDTAGSTTGWLRPSARVSLSVPISTLTPYNQMRLPFGLLENRAVPPVGSSTVEAGAYYVEMYMGRVWIEEEALAGTIGWFIDRIGETLGPDWTLTAGEGPSRGCGPQGHAYYVFGRLYCLNATEAAPPPDGEAEQGARETVAAALEEMRLMTNPDGSPVLETAYEDGERFELVKKWPYAFGALPVHSVGDVVGHDSHGLYGALIVEPAPVENGSGAAQELRPPVHFPACFAAAQGEACQEEFGVGATAPPVANLPSDFAASADLVVKARQPGEPDVTVREHVLLWQDGLNIWDRRGAAFSSYPPFLRAPKPLNDCRVCDDSYDWGDHAAGERTEPFFARLAGKTVSTVLEGNEVQVSIPRDIGPDSVDRHAEAQYSGRALYNPLSDYNTWPFPADFLAAGQDLPSGLSTPELEAASGQEVWLRVVQPAGRARQRAFLSTGPGYSDLFPGFGSGHSALLSARKSVTAAFRAPDWPAAYLWRDGPSQHVGGGVWGRFVVRDPSAQSAQQPPQQ